MLGWLRRTLTITLDMDWLYRRLVPAVLSGLERALGTAMHAGQAAIAGSLGRLEAWARAVHGPRGPLARTWASGAMGLGVMLMLLGFLLSYYLA
jgi:multicomponent Na+:H+ antiporter subunit D